MNHPLEHGHSTNVLLLSLILEFFGCDVLVGTFFSPRVAVVSAGDAFLPGLIGFPFEVCSLYGFAAESVAPFYS